jgi:nitrogen-specific signal transduction histidine kinase
VCRRPFATGFSTRGSGLGLTIAQTFVAQHHGSIEWSSVPGHTVFTIVIPLEMTRVAA